jgi:hypothetical protein
VIKYYVSLNTTLKNIPVEADDYMEAATRALEQLLADDPDMDIPPLVIVQDAERCIKDPNNFTWMCSSVPILANAGFYRVSAQMAKFFEKEDKKATEDLVV